MLRIYLKMGQEKLKHAKRKRPKISALGPPILCGPQQPSTSHPPSAYLHDPVPGGFLSFCRPRVHNPFQGFVPPIAARMKRTAQQMAMLHPEGYDEYYRDPNNRAPGQAGFIAPTPSQRYPERRMPVETPSGLKIHPAYRDLNGVPPDGPGFVPPGYFETTVDSAGKRPGRPGFVPPNVGTKAARGGAMPAPNAPLVQGGYDENYVDSHGRRPGDRGFVPPFKDAGLPQGFDADYHDANGRHQV